MIVISCSIASGTALGDRRRTALGGGRRRPDTLCLPGSRCSLHSGIQKYLAATVHALDRNYRSCPDIVLAAKRLIRHNRIRFDKDYRPALAEPGELVRDRALSAPCGEWDARSAGTRESAGAEFDQVLEQAKANAT